MSCLTLAYATALEKKPRRISDVLRNHCQLPFEDGNFGCIIESKNSTSNKTEHITERI